LVTRPAGHAIERRAVTRMRLDTSVACPLGQFLEARVLAVDLDVQLDDVLRIVRQRRFDRVDAEYQFTAHAPAPIRLPPPSTAARGKDFCGQVP